MLPGILAQVPLGEWNHAGLAGCGPRSTFQRAQINYISVESGGGKEGKESITLLETTFAFYIT